jgi:hypothetical protein
MMQEAIAAKNAKGANLFPHKQLPGVACDHKDVFSVFGVIRG